jgi:hypothetical protein
LNNPIILSQQFLHASRYSETAFRSEPDEGQLGLSSHPQGDSGDAADRPAGNLRVFGCSTDDGAATYAYGLRTEFERVGTAL